MQKINKSLHLISHLELKADFHSVQFIRTFIKTIVGDFHGVNYLVSFLLLIMMCDYQ